jgi:putative addiction module killer protein
MSCPSPCLRFTEEYAFISATRSMGMRPRLTSRPSTKREPYRAGRAGHAARRIERLAAGNPGDVQPVREGVSEMRIDYGPGYRVYFKRIGREIVILLTGGDKRTQSADIKTALRLARNL